MNIQNCIFTNRTYNLENNNKDNNSNFFKTQIFASIEYEKKTLITEVLCIWLQLTYYNIRDNLEKNDMHLAK